MKNRILTLLIIIAAFFCGLAWNGRAATSFPTTDAELDAFVRTVVADQMATGNLPLVRAERVQVRSYVETQSPEPIIDIFPEQINMNAGILNMGGGTIIDQGNEAASSPQVGFNRLRRK